MIQEVYLFRTILLEGSMLPPNMGVRYSLLHYIDGQSRKPG